MENKINVAELLKDCPKGMELDCAMYDNLYFESCQSDGYYDTTIKCYTLIGGIKTIIIFAKYGTFDKHSGAKCVIFPKGKTTWEGFQIPFVDGDIVAKDTVGGTQLFILKEDIGNGYAYCYMMLDDDGKAYFGVRSFCVKRLATEEEKRKLFDAIAANGYKWNAEVKILEKLIEPKFKVGDRIKHVVGREEVATVVGVEETHYNLDSKVGTSSFTISLQREWELVSKFDICTLKPYNKVLVRDNISSKWRIQFFERLSVTHSFQFVCMTGRYNQCVPYEGNEHLCGTSEDCDEFYKTWEE